MNRKHLLIMTFICLTFFISGCQQENNEPEFKPSQSQMQTICNLAVLKCYCHNVAKYEEGVDTWYTKGSLNPLSPLNDYKHFWVEYDGIVDLGIDASKMSMQISDQKIIIHIPKAKVINCEVDNKSIRPGSFITDPNSTDITSSDHTYAIAMAQKKLKLQFQKDKQLLNEAQLRTQTLLEGYIKNIGKITGKNYTIQWEEIPDETQDQ